MNAVDQFVMPLTELQRVRREVTPAELQVWELIAKGSTRKEVAWILKKSVKTIENQLCSLRSRLRCQGAADLTRAAIRYRIITVEVLPES